MRSSTIRDVARLAQVSVATVSRVLNGSAPVADATRERILDAARELRYSPHGAARSLSSRRTGALGVILPDLHGEFFSELLRGVDQTAQAQGLHLLVSSSHHDRDGLLSALQAMHGRVDGLLVMAPDLDGAALDHALPARLPVVLVSCASVAPRAGAAMRAIDVDNEGGAVAMTRHLLALGRRRIAFVAGPPENADARGRLEGFRRALAEASGGAGGVEAVEIAGDFSERSGWHAAHALLDADGDRERAPTAIFAANDAMAIGALSALRERGREVPGDVAVVGFDDIPMSRYMHPPLSTVRVDISTLGATATGRLLELLTGPPPDMPARDVLPTTLVVRASCGGRPPPDQQDHDELPRRAALGTSTGADGRDRSRTTHTQ